MVEPITIGAANCVAMTGVSWTFVRRFAASHGVPIWRVAARKQLVPAAPLLAALKREGERAPAREVTFEEELARGRAALGMELRPEPELDDDTALARLISERGMELRK